MRTGAGPEAPADADAPRAARPLTRLLVVVGLLVTLGAAAGAAVPGAHGARLTGDEPHYLLSALSLAEDGDLDIADELAEERWRSFHRSTLTGQGAPRADGRWPSPHSPLLPVLLAVPMALGGWVAAKLTMAVLAGLLASLLVWTAVRRLGVPPRVAAVTVSLFCLSPPLAVYATQIYPELPAALAITGAVALLTGRLGPAARWGLAALVVALPWLAVKYVPVAAVLALAGLARLHRGGATRAAVAQVAALAVAGAGFLAANRAVYGGWTPYAAARGQFAGGELGVMGAHPDLAERTVRLLGLLVDAGYGLAVWQPAWPLVVVAVVALVRRRPTGWLPVVPVLAAGWLTAALVAETMHGWWFPGRHALAVLPVAVLAVAWWASRVRARLAVVTVLGALGVATYAWLLVEAAVRGLTWVTRLAGTTSPLARVAAVVMPDLHHPGRLDWALTVGWALAVATLAVAAWRTERSPTPEDARAGT